MKIDVLTYYHNFFDSDGIEHQNRTKNVEISKKKIPYTYLYDDLTRNII